MMDHVEECPSYYVDCLGTICDCDYMHICMCRELRACEERMLTTYLARDNFEAGLDAAREAVLGAKAVDVASGRGLDEPAQFVWLNNALSAIDALRKEPQ